MVLANCSKGQIYDMYLQLPNLHKKCSKYPLRKQSKDVVGSMDNLPFQNEELDLIWSEGAIYNIGFERGMNEWNRFWKRTVHRVTEASWFTPERPAAEIEDFWLISVTGNWYYPDKNDTNGESRLYTMTHFILPENCWTEHFYAPPVPGPGSFWREYSGNAAAADLVPGSLAWTGSVWQV